jgi:hypothetical protein
MVSFLFDIILVALLVVGILFCYQLNSRLKNIRHMGEELSPFMKNVSGYIGHISGAIDKLKGLTDSNAQSLQEKIPEVLNLKDDFDILLEYGERMANRLDEIIEKARSVDTRLKETLDAAEKVLETRKTLRSDMDLMSNQKAAEQSHTVQNGHLNSTTQYKPEIPQFIQETIQEKEFAHAAGNQAHLNQGVMNQSPITQAPVTPPVNHAPVNHASVNPVLANQMREQIPSQTEQSYDSESTKAFFENLMQADFIQQNQSFLDNMVPFQQKERPVREEQIQKGGIMSKLRGLR